MSTTTQSTEILSPEAEKLQHHSSIALSVAHAHPDAWQLYLRKDTEPRRQAVAIRNQLLTSLNDANHESEGTWSLGLLEEYHRVLAALFEEEFGEKSGARITTVDSLSKYIHGILDSKTNLFIARHVAQSTHGITDIPAPLLKVAMMQGKQNMFEGQPPYKGIVEAVQHTALYELIQLLWKQRCGGQLHVVSGQNPRMTVLARAIARNQEITPLLNCIEYLSNEELGIGDMRVREAVQELLEDCDAAGTDEKEEQLYIKLASLGGPTDQQRIALAHIYARGGALKFEEKPTNALCGEDSYQHLIARAHHVFDRSLRRGDGQLVVSSTQQLNAAGVPSAKRLSEAGLVTVNHGLRYKASDELSPFPM